MTLIKPGIKRLEEYTVTQDLDCVKLNQNESPDDLPPEVRRAVLERLGRVRWNRYPDGAAAELIGRLSVYAGFPASGLLVGNGSNELIQTLVSAVCGAGDSLATVTPGFAVYKRVAATLEVGVIEVPLRRDFGFDVGAIIEQARSAKLVFLASPNNPTGTTLDLADVEKIADSLGGLVVIDEAYFEFHGETAAPLIAARENLVVLRTFSKALGLAGLRLGYLLGPAAVVRELGKAKLPFSVGALQQAVAIEILERRDLIERRVRDIVAERERLTAELKRLPGIVPYPSRANFLLFELGRRAARDVYERLHRQGVLVRPFGGPRLENVLRVTVGTAEENEAFLSRLRLICEEPAP